jgi:hypothetical protein
LREDLTIRADIGEGFQRILEKTLTGEKELD